MSGKVKKAKQTMAALIRAGHSWAEVIDRVAAGFRLTPEEKDALRCEYEARDVRAYSS